MREGKSQRTSNGQPIRLTRAQVREIDRRSIEQYHLPGIVLMENASRAAADLVRDGQSGWGTFKKVLILCGGGNNGGDGLAVARHLHNYGLDVEIGLTVDPTRYRGDARVNWEIVSAMRLPVHQATPQTITGTGAGFIIDAIFGTGLDQQPRDPFPAIARAVSDAGQPVLAIDVPSGLDCDTGEALGACIRAHLTITFVVEKAGFANPASKGFTGVVRVGDIGCPRELIDEIAGSPTPPASG